MMKRCAIVLVAIMAAGASHAAEHIGRVKRLQGMAEVARDGAVMALAQNDPVYAGDVLRTGADGAVGVLFADDTRFSIGPDAQAVLDSFVYDPNGGSLDFAVSLARGTAAFVTGRIGKFSPESVAVRSPVATIGVRGTRFAVASRESRAAAVDAATTPEFYRFWPFLNRLETQVVLLPDEEGGVGAVVVEGRGGAAALDEENEAVVMRRAGAAPEQGFADAESVAAAFGDALAHIPAPAARFVLGFPSGEATLTAEARAAIARAAREARAQQAADVDVVGHTDRAGETEKNVALSQARARAVRDALVAAGLSAEAVTLAFHGEAEPIVPTADGVAEARNRRVEIVVR